MSPDPRAALAALSAAVRTGRAPASAENAERVRLLHDAVNRLDAEAARAALAADPPRGDPYPSYTVRPRARP